MHQKEAALKILKERVSEKKKKKASTNICHHQMMTVYWECGNVIVDDRFGLCPFIGKVISWCN